jgi:hypothetical protein
MADRHEPPKLSEWNVFIGKCLSAGIDGTIQEREIEN